MKRLHKIQFLVLILILFGVFTYKTYEQYQDIEYTQELLIKNESKALATFIEAFRATYQDTILKNHIEITDQTIKLLPAQTIREISKNFSSSLHGDIIIRTVSDRPRNPDNMANKYELNMMQFYRKNSELSSDFRQEDESYFYTKPLYIKAQCLKCHSKGKDALPNFRKEYDQDYDYKLGELRGILSIEIKDRKQFEVLYEDLIYNIIISMFTFLILGGLIYILVRKISLMEKEYTDKLEEKVIEKIQEIEQQSTTFETLFEKSMLGTLIIKDGKFIQCNGAIVEMLQYSSKEEVLKLHPSELSPEIQPDGQSSFEKAEKMMQVTAANGGHSFEWMHRRANGKDFWVYVKLTPISLPDGDVIHVSWSDISKRKELEEKVKLHTENLENKNLELDTLMKVEVEKNKKQQEVLFEQSRMAQMGEMLSMIAHQWRQPLGAISATSIDLNLKLELGLFATETEKGREEAEKYFINSLEQIDALVQSLTLTIDDFRNFYKPNKQRKKLLLSEPVQKAYAIFEATLKNTNVKVTQEYSSKEIVDLYSNELMQVVLNILQNANDKFLAQKTHNPKLEIKTFDTSTSSIISIYDNGGAIKSDVINKIFDPYFSTKSEKNGTGLGLYMSKIIVEEHHHGILSVVNFNDRVCFTIEIFKEGEKSGNR